MTKSSFVGKKFYTSDYAKAHPDELFQHRGKGRWYPVDSIEETLPPPQQRKRAIKDEQQAVPSLGTQEPQARVTRKREPVNLDKPVELKETRTRKRRALGEPIAPTDGGDSTPPEPAELPEPKRRKSSSDDDQEANPKVATPAPAKVTKPRAPPKPRKSPPRKRSPPGKKTAAALKKEQEPLKYNFVGTKGLWDEPGLAFKQEMNLDFEEMGITQESLAKRKPEPPVDAMTQRPSTLRALAEKLDAKRTSFDKKQAKKATARRGGIAKKAGASTQLSVDEEGQSTTWVLFQPRHGFPPVYLGEPPEIFVRLATYKPGNAKIIAYNTESFNCTLRKVPKAFEGCEVDYTKSGPKLVAIREDSPVDVRGMA